MEEGKEDGDEEGEDAEFLPLPFIAKIRLKRSGGSLMLFLSLPLPPLPLPLSLAAADVVVVPAALEEHFPSGGSPKNLHPPSSSLPLLPPLLLALSLASLSLSAACSRAPG